MSRSLSSSLLTQLANPTNTFCFLLEINTSTVFRLTDNQFDVTYDSNTYTSSGEIIAVNTTPETGELKVEETSIELSNINSTLISVFDDQNYIDNTVNIYLGFFDSNDSTTNLLSFGEMEGDVKPGYFYTSIDGALRVCDGNYDNFSYLEVEEGVVSDALLTPGSHIFVKYLNIY